MKVFSLNDYEWYAAETLEEAIAAEMKDTGLPRDEVVDGFEGELTEEQMDTLRYHDEDGQSRTFREHLQRMQEEGVEFPCLFARRRMITVTEF